jgi:hypothetical protein
VEKKEKFYRINYADGSGDALIVQRMGDFEDCCGTVEYDEVGTKYSIEVIELTKKEIDDMPEWGGF